MKDDEITEKLEAIIKSHDSLREEIRTVLNKHCAENASDTPDFILAEFLMGCLYAFDQATRTRSDWYRPQDDREICTPPNE